jgi:hypothetical protein
VRVYEEFFFLIRFYYKKKLGNTFILRLQQQASKQANKQASNQKKVWFENK